MIDLDFLQKWRYIVEMVQNQDKKTISETKKKLARKNKSNT